MSAIEKLEKRVREIRARAAVRAWEMRQHGRARGAWFAVEQLFALSAKAWVIGEADVQVLLAAGFRPHEAGLRLQPARHYFVVDAAEIAKLSHAREIALMVSSELLNARMLALVPFP
jgi:hypothetical protein